MGFNSGFKGLKCSHSRVTTTAEVNLHSTEQLRSLSWPFTLQLSRAESYASISDGAARLLASLDMSRQRIVIEMVLSPCNGAVTVADVACDLHTQVGSLALNAVLKWLDGLTD